MAGRKTAMAVAAHIIVLLMPAMAGAMTLLFDDLDNPEAVTGFRGIDLRGDGYGRYDVLITSNLDEGTDGWAATSAFYFSRFSGDVFPSEPDSTELTHRLKRAMARVLVDADVPFISGLDEPGSTDYIVNVTRLGVQRLLIPYQATADDLGVLGTFVSGFVGSGFWGPDDLHGNSFSNGINAGTTGSYWAIVSDAVDVNEPSTLGLMLLLLGGLAGRVPNVRARAISAPASAYGIGLFAKGYLGAVSQSPGSPAVAPGLVTAVM